MHNGQNTHFIALNDLIVWLAHQSWQISQPPSFFHCEPAWKWKPAPLRDFDFWMVFRGRGLMTVAGQTYEISAGRWFLFQPGDTPSASHDPENPLVVFLCHFQTASQERLQPSLLFGVSRELNRRDAELAAQAFWEESSGRELASAMLRQMLLHAVHEQSRKPVSTGRSRLDGLAMEIRSAPGRNWTVAEMAQRCALSPPHLNRLWRSAWGMAPGQFVIRERVSRAVLLLRESDLTIQQIADALGYRDVFFFHRQFRNLTGTTPRSVRQGAETRFDEKRPTALH